MNNPNHFRTTPQPAIRTNSACHANLERPETGTTSSWLDYMRRKLAKTEQFQQVVAERGADYAEFDVVLAACELYRHHQGDFSRLGR